MKKITAFSAVMILVLFLAACGMTNRFVAIETEVERMSYIQSLAPIQTPIPILTPQPRVSVPDHYPESAYYYLPIASGYLYYVVIGDAIFKIQDRFDFDFIPPAHAEFVFIGTTEEIQNWERTTARLSMAMPDDFNESYFVVIDLYDSIGNRTGSLISWTPDSDLDPDTDTVSFIGSWNQIRSNNIVDTQQLNRYLRAIIDPYDIYHVRFPGNWGAWAIQDARDWDFVPPSSVEVETEIIEHSDSEYGSALMLITFILFDENHNMLGQYNTQLWLFDDAMPIPEFTGAYKIGTLADLGGVGS